MAGSSSSVLSMTGNRGFKVLHIDLRRSRVATAQLEQYAVEVRADILLVQDPYVKDSKLVGLPTGRNLFPSVALTAVVVVIHQIYYEIIVSILHKNRSKDLKSKLYSWTQHSS